MPNDPPAGWKLVPAALEAALRAVEAAGEVTESTIRRAITAYLAAAPEPPAAPPDAMREKLRALSDKAASGEWFADSDYEAGPGWNGIIRRRPNGNPTVTPASWPKGEGWGINGLSEEDAEFIVAAVNFTRAALEPHHG